MKLQPKDFMIGDWVLVDGKPEQLTGVDREYIHLEGNVSTILLEGEVEPIPLTPEILEKNGFICTQCDDEEIGTYESWSFQSDFIAITCEPTLCMLDVFNGHLVKEIKFYTEESTFFVHELQHALKLCQISKEIIL